MITRLDEARITTDNIGVAQFIYLLQHNEKIRGVIDTITSKVLLILDRFSEDRKIALDAVTRSASGTCYRSSSISRYRLAAR